MTKTNNNSKNGSANAEDFSPVAICFRDPTINYLFADLLEVRGVRTKILSDILDVETETKIITEPIYLPDLSPSQIKKCLVVANSENSAEDEFSALTLVRPLTEEKIESAITEFLKS